MVFNSLEFVGFFVVTILIYFILPLRARWLWLLGASVYFCVSAQPFSIVLIAAATLVAFFFGQRIEAAPDKSVKQSYLIAALVLLVGNLVAFKYTSFFNETFRSIAGWIGVSYQAPVLHILLPIGISFYTFQLISYLVDVLRGEKAERKLGIFALYTAFFPKLVAGPIERAKNLLPQLHTPQPFNYANAALGLQLITWGAFKKIVVADRIAPYVDAVYKDPHAWDGVSLAFATWLYAFQIYFDFSGYTDIALGVALIMGFKLTQNFNRPYFATSVQDFWKRWHISLTSWLTDYIYTPLTRSTWIKMKWYDLMLLSLGVTFLVSGFWHGAEWTFVAWGALHGAFVVLSHMLQKPYNKFARDIGLVKRKNLHRALKVIVTFTLVCFAYILFRAQSLPDAFYVMTHLHTGWSEAPNGLMSVIWSSTGTIEGAIALFGIAFVMLIEFLQGRVDFKTAVAAKPAWQRWSLYFAGAFSIALLGAFYSGSPSFIYFRF